MKRTIFCTQCGKSIWGDFNSDQQVECPHCNETFNAPIIEMAYIPSGARIRKYPALRTIALSIKIFAILIALGGILLTDYASELMDGSVLGIIIYLLVVGFYVLLVWASSEMILVLLDIEENTRK